MAIINLKNRITQSNHQFDDNKKSSKSYIYVTGSIQFDKSSDETLILTVGDNYIENSQKIAIKDKGLVVKPGETKLICTSQKISTPLNVIGIIHGIGANIFNGGFISAGKIDQGFSGHLKIGYHNAGKHKVTFKKNDVLACVVFHETEETMKTPRQEQDYDSMPNYKITVYDTIKQFLSTHWISLVSLLVAILALIFDFIKEKI